MYEALTAVVFILLLVGAIVIAHGALDSYRTLEHMLIVVLVMAGCGALIGGLSFPLLMAQLGSPVILGVVVGSWPDVWRLWPTRVRANVAQLPGALPDLAGALLGLVVGVWVWSALASSFGVLGVLLGAVAFVVAVLGLGSTPTMIQWLLETRSDRGPGGGGPRAD